MLRRNDPLPLNSLSTTSTNAHWHVQSDSGASPLSDTSRKRLRLEMGMVEKVSISGKAVLLPPLTSSIVDIRQTFAEKSGYNRHRVVQDFVSYAIEDPDHAMGENSLNKFCERSPRIFRIQDEVLRVCI